MQHAVFRFPVSAKVTKQEDYSSSKADSQRAIRGYGSHSGIVRSGIGIIDISYFQGSMVRGRRNKYTIWLVHRTVRSGSRGIKVTRELKQE